MLAPLCLPGSLLSSSCRRLALGGALLALALPWGRAEASSDDSLPSDSVQVALPGWFHAGTAPTSDGETWFFAQPGEDGVRFVAGPLRVERLAAEDEGLPDSERLQAPEGIQALFMLRGVPSEVLARAATCEELLDDAELHPGGRVLREEEVFSCAVERQPRASLRARRAAPAAEEPADAEDAAGPPGLELVLTDGVREQVLGAYAQDGNGMGEVIHVLWAGDLDGDGALDVLTDERLHYNQTVNLVLYLSSAAEGEELVAPAARFEDFGC